ncbi:hypothetical protein F-S17_0144 [Faustovirus]|nr:hypothetical protein F-S17_0144 [Faustovirus]
METKTNGVSRVCTCGHEHKEHAKQRDDTHVGEIYWCNHENEKITGYTQRTTTRYNYRYGEWANSGYQAPYIFHNYGGNTAPYMPNSYTNSYNGGTTVYITTRQNTSPATMASYQSHEGMEPIIEKTRCKCNRCQCDYCKTPECAAEQAQLRAENEANWQNFCRIENEKRKIWSTGTFAERRQLRGTVRAVLKTLSDFFVCGRSRE